jgi:hypothetical protein
MPDEAPCPVVASFVRHAQHRLNSDAICALYGDVSDDLDKVFEYSKTQPKDEVTQRLRAFFCLNELFACLSVSLGGHRRSISLDREGISGLIEFCSEVRRAEEVKLYVMDLSRRKRGFDPLIKVEGGNRADLAHIIVNAAEYMRPRLRNKRSMAGMGMYFAKGLAREKVSLETFVTQATRLASVTSEDRGDAVWG